VPGAEWVVEGEGVATRKWDGSCCMVRDGKIYKRYELKKGKKAPLFFEPMQEPDPVTGAVPGWVPCGNGPEDKWFQDAFANEVKHFRVPDGTYEAIGPHFGGGNHVTNPECREVDMLERHGECILDDVPRDFEGLKKFFSETVSPNFEGIVWHHVDGRMVKIKARDFGIKRR